MIPLTEVLSCLVFVISKFRRVQGSLKDIPFVWPLAGSISLRIHNLLGCRNGPYCLSVLNTALGLRSRTVRNTSAIFFPYTDLLTDAGITFSFQPFDQILVHRRYTEGILRDGVKIWILFSSGKTIIYERAQRVFYSKIYRNYVIDKFTGEIMENQPLESRM